MTAAVETPYIYTIDPFPQQTREHNKLYPFFEHLRQNRLTSTRCEDCGKVSWPPRTICPECISDRLAWVDLPTEGTVYAFTVQRSGIPLGYKAPMIFALVDFGAVRILAAVVDSDPERIKVGSRVRLVVKEIPNKRVLPFFTLV